MPLLLIAVARDRDESSTDPWLSFTVFSHSRFRAESRCQDRRRENGPKLGRDLLPATLSTSAFQGQARPPLLWPSVPSPTGEASLICCPPLPRALGLPPGSRPLPQWLFLCSHPVPWIHGWGATGMTSALLRRRPSAGPLTGDNAGWNKHVSSVCSCHSSSSLSPLVGSQPPCYAVMYYELAGAPCNWPGTGGILTLKYLFFLIKNESVPIVESMENTKCIEN